MEVGGRPETTYLEIEPGLATTNSHYPCRNLEAATLSRSTRQHCPRLSESQVPFWELNLPLEWSANEAMWAVRVVVASAPLEKGTTKVGRRQENSFAHLSQLWAWVSFAGGNGEPGFAGTTGIGLPNWSGKGNTSEVTGFAGIGWPSGPGKGRNSDGVAAVA